MDQDQAEIANLDKSPITNELNSKILKIKQAIDFLSKYEVKVGILTRLRQGTTIGMKEADLSELASRDSVVDSLVDELALKQKK